MLRHGSRLPTPFDIGETRTQTKCFESLIYSNQAPRNGSKVPAVRHASLPVPLRMTRFGGKRSRRRNVTEREYLASRMYLYGGASGDGAWLAGTGPRCGRSTETKRVGGRCDEEGQEERIAARSRSRRRWRNEWGKKRQTGLWWWPTLLW